MRIRPWLVLVLAALFLGACILPPQQTTEPDDDDASQDDDDDTGDDDTGDDDTGDDDTGDDDTGDDDTGDDDTGDDDTGDDDTGDDDTGPDFPVGDFSVMWGWSFGYDDPTIGAAYGSYEATVTLAANNSQIQIFMFLFDETWNDLCLMRFQGNGTPEVPQQAGATAGWDFASGVVALDQCYEQQPGSPLPFHTALAPDPAAMAEIEAAFGITVAEQEAARDNLETTLGLTASGYFMFWGEDIGEMSPLGFLFEE